MLGAQIFRIIPSVNSSSAFFWLAFKRPNFDRKRAISALRKRSMRALKRTIVGLIEPVPLSSMALSLRSLFFRTAATPAPLSEFR